MGTDRFVHFELCKVPGRGDIGTLIEDYLGDVMRSKECGGGRWTVSLIGPCSFPLRRLEPEWTPSKAWAEEHPTPRWIEVYIGQDNIDVITRHQDELTMVIADGLAKLIARYWKGRLEDAD